MLKKYISIFMIVLGLTCSSAAAFTINKVQPMSAQNKEILISNARQHGSITAHDVDNYLTIGKDMHNALRKKDRVLATQIMQQVGWKYNQGMYISTKIDNGYWLLEEPENYSEWLQQIEMPGEAIPTQKELDIIRKYKNKLFRIVVR